MPALSSNGYRKQKADPFFRLDKKIGFSKDTLHPVTKDQYSLIYAQDTQEIRGVTYGWHPLRGKDSYIQQRMGAIFADTMRSILPVALKE